MPSKYIDQSTATLFRIEKILYFLGNIYNLQWLCRSQMEFLMYKHTFTVESKTEEKNARVSSS